MLINPDLAAELRAIIRAELQLAVRAIVDDGLEPMLSVVAEMQAKLSGLLVTQSESMGAIVEGQAKIEASQARIERALASFRADDDNEPWRASLEDVELDEDD